MTWFTLSILSIFALAGAELTQQHLLTRKNPFDERTSAVLTFLFQALCTIPFLFIFGVSDQIFSIFNPEVFPKVLIVTIISAISMVLYLRSFKVKNISISTIFTSLSVIVSTTLGILFLGESIGSLKFIGIALILTAIVITNLRNPIIEKNHFYGLAAGLIFGISYTLDKSILLTIHPLVYIFWAFLLVALWGFIFGNSKVRQMIRSQPIIAYQSIVISGFAYFLYNFFTFTAYRWGGEIGRIDAINNTQVFLIILFEFFVLKHTEGIARKLFSAALAIIGILLLRIA